MIKKLNMKPIVLLLSLLVSPFALAAEPAPALLPALNDPPTQLRVPGKFIWADYFTSDVEAARRFYGELFDWEWRWINSTAGRQYGMFYKDGFAVAGVAERPGADPDPDRPYGRWIYYLSVADVGRSVSDVEARGGRVLLEQRSYPDRGEFAILADPEGALFGVMDSTTGDPEDFQAEAGEWIWISLYSRNATQAAQLYASMFGYNTYEPEEESEVLDIVLASQGKARAGVGTLSENAESHPTWLGYVRVKDVNATAGRAAAFGGEALYGPDESIVGGDLAVIADPLGAMFGLLRWTFDAEDPQEDQR